MAVACIQVPQPLQKLLSGGSWSSSGSTAVSSRASIAEPLTPASMLSAPTASSSSSSISSSNSSTCDCKCNLAMDQTLQGESKRRGVLLAAAQLIADFFNQQGAAELLLAATAKLAEAAAAAEARSLGNCSTCSSGSGGAAAEERAEATPQDHEDPSALNALVEKLQDLTALSAHSIREPQGPDGPLSDAPRLIQEPLPAGPNTSIAPCPAAARPLLNLASPTLNFCWLLLPPFFERPQTIRKLCCLARGPHQALHDGDRLCVGHIHVHPNSLPPRDERGPGTPEGSWAKTGCLARVSFGALVTLQFHLPHLSEVFWLLEGLIGSSCHSLRKIVDRQSRWRPREQRFEGLDDASKRHAAKLAADFCNSSMRSLRHLEGPVFAVLLRARAAQQAVGGAADAEGATSSAAATAPALVSSSSSSHRSSSSSSFCSSRSCGNGKRGTKEAVLLGDTHHSGFDCTEVLHLVDVAPEDLQGLNLSVYPQLRKLVLLNLPPATPGVTVQAIASFLGKAPNLAELQLDFQFFDPSTWELDALQAFLDRVQAPNSKITKLAMEWCRLGDAGVQRVCRSLSRHTGGGLTELSLAHCEFRDVRSVCELLTTPGLKLKRLDLSSNSLDDRQAEKLAKALPSSSLEELRLRDSQVSLALPVKTEWWWGC
mmetsp:Transcript_25574/g.59543  ORF Transcript_25574/g.59543 Transcript_25574/m.59543 type:complete len:656 (-) Transcript_25574:39-2006(-)